MGLSQQGAGCQLARNMTYVMVLHSLYIDIIRRNVFPLNDPSSWSKIIEMTLDNI